MRCQYCGTDNSDDNKYCMGCGRPIGAGAAAANSAPAVMGWTQKLLPKRRRGLAISIAVSAVLLAVLILVLALNANPVAGRWYAKSGAELIMLQNGKGMTAADASGGAGRTHFMYTVGYREPGYVEGLIYKDGDAGSAWLYLYDGVLEFDGEYFYRQKPAQNQ